jgi:ABC-type enterochelin transport system permease subunit
MIGTTLIVLIVLSAAIWIIIEAKRFEHKIFALILIGLILFGYFSTASVFKEEDVDFTSFSGIYSAGKIYLSWMGGFFNNIKTITANIINMDWKLDKNETQG